MESAINTVPIVDTVTSMSDQGGIAPTTTKCVNWNTPARGSENRTVSAAHMTLYA